MSFESPRLDIAAETKIKRLLIVRLSAMGDVIHTLPAVQALRQAFPQAFIGWLIEERWAELLCAPGSPRRGPRSSLRPLVDEVHSVNLKAWGKSALSVSTVQRVATVWNDVRETHYDAAVDLQGAMRSAVLARWSGARVVYGAAEPREAPASLWYARKVVAHGRHVVEQNLSIAEALVEHRVKLPPIELPHDPRAEKLIERRLAEHGIGEFAILNPGAGWGAKRWPAERYGEVARKLAGLGVTFDCQLRSGRGRIGARSGSYKRRNGASDELHQYALQHQRTDRADPPRAFVYWRRYRAASFGGGVAGSGSGDFWAYGSGAQRALWNKEHRVAQRGERYLACAAGST